MGCVSSSLGCSLMFVWRRPLFGDRVRHVLIRPSSFAKSHSCEEISPGKTLHLEEIRTTGEGCIPDTHGAVAGSPPGVVRCIFWETFSTTDTKKDLRDIKHRNSMPAIMFWYHQTDMWFNAVHTSRVFCWRIT